MVAGLTYQFLPFMVLPLYVSLEKIDLRLIEAARDLYAGPWRRGGAWSAVVGGTSCRAASMAARLPPAGGSAAARGRLVSVGVLGAAIGSLLVSEAFVRIVFPLSLPGVFAGSILTFIPAIGDYVNAELLGNPKTQMIGNVIQNRYLTQNDYPTAPRPVVPAHGGHPHRRSSCTPASSAPRS